MTLNCPVCDRTINDEMVCPNCETDLTTYQMLVNLPSITTRDKKKKALFPLWLTVTILALLLGLSLGFVGNSVVAERSSKSPQAYARIATPIPEIDLESLNASSLVVRQLEAVKDYKSPVCDGFDYVVRRGDSLSAIANNFYGNPHYLARISRANIQLEGRKNHLEIGERILIPNLDATC